MPRRRAIAAFPAGGPFSLLTGTFLEGTRSRTAPSGPSSGAGRGRCPCGRPSPLCGVSDTTVRDTFTLFRSQIPEEFTLLEGQVQPDEAFFGGKKGLGLMLGKQVGTRKLAHAIVPVDVQREHAFHFLF